MYRGEQQNYKQQDYNRTWLRCCMSVEALKVVTLLILVTMMCHHSHTFSESAGWTSKPAHDEQEILSRAAAHRQPVPHTLQPLHSSSLSNLKELMAPGSIAPPLYVPRFFFVFSCRKSLPRTWCTDNSIGLTCHYTAVAYRCSRADTHVVPQDSHDGQENMQRYWCTSAAKAPFVAGKQEETRTCPRISCAL